MNIKLDRAIISAIVYVIIAQVVHTVGAVATIDLYLDPMYFQVWSKIMMPGTGTPPMSFMYMSLLFGFIGGLIFALFYGFTKSLLPGKESLAKGLYYGTMIFLLAGIPMSLTLTLLINVPTVLIFTWATEALLIYWIAGVTTARIMK